MSALEMAQKMWAAAQLSAELLGEANPYTSLSWCCEPYDLVIAFAEAAAVELRYFKYEDGGLILGAEARLHGVYISCSGDRVDLGSGTAFAIGMGESVDFSLLHEEVQVKIDALLSGHAVVTSKKPNQPENYSEARAA